MTEFSIENGSQEQKKRKPGIKFIVFLALGVLIIAAVTVGVLYQLNKQNLIKQVISGLEQVPALMEKAKSDTGGGYPSTITAELLPKSDDVDFVGQGSFDGTTYCVTGTSKKNKSIEYHISASLKQPEEGSCQSAASLPAPNIPGNLAIQVVGTRQASFSWAETTYATSYTLECASDTEFTVQKHTKVLTTNSGMCEELATNTKYYARVQATNKSGSSNWSQILEFKTPLLSVAPANVVATATSSSTFSYSWDAVPSASQYIIERASDNSFTQEVVTVVVSAGASMSGVFTNLKPDTYYWIHIKAVTPDFASDRAAFSPVVEVRTLKVN